jgi:SAM-dependent methyltransferase
LNGTLRELKAMYRKNGTERALKSCVRFFVFDWIWRRRLRKELKQRGHDLVMPENRLLLQDAASVDWPEHSLDMICSESVFEHIPRESLETLLQKMAHWLKPNGLALIRPDVFTGISGGHMLEWFDLGENRKRRSEPWEHLRQKRYRGNVYLNELTRADLRKLFSQRFEILEENVVDPNQGRQFYTPEIAEELKHYGEDELFSNGVQFVLRPKIPSCPSFGLGVCILRMACRPFPPEQRNGLQFVRGLHVDDICDIFLSTQLFEMSWPLAK